MWGIYVVAPEKFISRFLKAVLVSPLGFVDQETAEKYTASCAGFVTIQSIRYNNSSLY